MFYNTLIDSVRRRFNQGLLFDLNTNKVVTNLEKLNSITEYEYAETPNPNNDSFNTSMSATFGQIINKNLYNFKNGISESNENSTIKDIYSEVTIKYLKNYNRLTLWSM
jgi:hypothetical protein